MMSFNCVINGKGFTTFENLRLKNALESQSPGASYGDCDEQGEVWMDGGQTAQLSVWW